MADRFPKSFLYTMIIYAFSIILVIVNFVSPLIYYGLITELFAEFVIFALPAIVLALMPLILFLFYYFDDKFPRIKQHETAMRLIITIFVVISVFIAMFFAVLI